MKDNPFNFEFCAFRHSRNPATHGCCQYCPPAALKSDFLADYNVVYAFSGLQGSVRPLAPLGEKYVTVSLADGTALEPDKIYTVATWEGMVWGRYAQKVVASYPETFQEIFTEYLKINSPISPAKDGRMKLLWS